MYLVHTHVDLDVHVHVDNSHLTPGQAGHVVHVYKLCTLYINLHDTGTSS